MSSTKRGPHRGDLRQALRRDLERHARHDAGHREFWRSLGMIGAVGWPIALCAAGGAWLGHHLDRRLGTGLQFTLGLLTLGLVAGAWTAWRMLRDRHDP